MKVEIDLNDILGNDDYGQETLQESIKRQVIDRLISQVKDGIDKQINTEVSKAIRVMIEENIKSIMPDTISELMQAEYVQVDRYGDRSKESTTFRKELVKAIHEQMVYKKTSYESDRSAFTKAVDSVVSENVSQFKTEFNKVVDGAFVKEAFEYAQQKLFLKLGVGPK